MHRSSPPPFFNQGPSAHARLALFALLSIAMLVADARFGVLAAMRQGVGTVLYPLERALLVPRDAARIARDYAGGMDRLRAENAELRRIEAANAKTLLEAEQLAAENARLRDLVEARERVAVRSVVAEVLYDTRDPYAHKLVLDRGLQHGVLPGQPVIDAQGVVGQITRVQPLSSEVTLITDRNSALPVELTRTGRRSIAFGGDASGRLELRFLSAGSDVKPGDALVTSGLDGVFPAGLPVGTVTDIEAAGGAASFARVLVQPVAHVDQTRMMLVLMIDRSALPPFPTEPAPETRKRRARN